MSGVNEPKIIPVKQRLRLVQGNGTIHYVS